MSELLELVVCSLQNGGTPIGKPPGERSFLFYNRGEKVVITKDYLQQMENHLGESLVVVPDPTCAYAVTQRQADRLGLPCPRTMLADAII